VHIKQGKGLRSPRADGDDVFAGEEEVTAMVISDGGGLGWRTDGGM
jgi:hypothetical protein